MIEFAYLGISPNTTKILKTLGDILGTDKGWFISGSFANSDVKEPSDVDVYFTDEKLLDKVPSLIFNKDDICVIIQTSRAFTVNVKGIVLKVQEFTLKICKGSSDTGSFHIVPSGNNTFLHTFKSNFSNISSQVP